MKRKRQGISFLRKKIFHYSHHRPTTTPSFSHSSAKHLKNKLVKIYPMSTYPRLPPNFGRCGNNVVLSSNYRKQKKSGDSNITNNKSDSLNWCSACPVDSLCQLNCEYRKLSTVCVNCSSYNGRCNNNILDLTRPYSNNLNSNKN